MNTIGNLIDSLCVTTCRIWAAEDIKRKIGASDKEIADATRLTNICNQQRTDLIQEIDERLNDISEGKKQKLYKQGEVKLYGK